ncbi:hypothetical protein ZIOFF_057481 [Zingiber officinale]|uniref:Uncharacterized protein n=1 Tax=Zingiber officinale TaxID=94328 RepID=A0A8J5F3D3_ZINOF|nr:hypothetical protein ZIOFF_057481 [Zingiber officinale]
MLDAHLHYVQGVAWDPFGHYVALSALWKRKDDQRALSYAERSLRIVYRHISSHIMKGNLYLSLNRPDATITAFRAAQELRSDFHSYQGLVSSYLALAKNKEAFFTAWGAMKIITQSAKALKLVGDVHASSSSERKKARMFDKSALLLEPGFLEAALALAEWHVVDGRHKDAILRDMLKRLPSVEMSFESNVKVWGALLNGATVHGDDELGHFAFEHLLESELGCKGNYLLMVNLYSKVVRWEEVRESVEKCLRDAKMDKNNVHDV